MVALCCRRERGKKWLFIATFSQKTDNLHSCSIFNASSFVSIVSRLTTNHALKTNLQARRSGFCAHPTISRHSKWKCVFIRMMNWFLSHGKEISTNLLIDSRRFRLHYAPGCLLDDDVITLDHLAHHLIELFSSHVVGRGLKSLLKSGRKINKLSQKSNRWLNVCLHFVCDHTIHTRESKTRK